MKQKLLKLWLNFVEQVALLSNCERRKVGCLLVSVDGERLLSFGYNGVARGENEPTNDVEGHPAWVHAEANALVKSRSLEPFIVISTDAPCERCARLLINAHPEEVILKRPYRDPTGLRLLMGFLGLSRVHTLFDEIPLLKEKIKKGDVHQDD